MKTRLVGQNRGYFSYNEGIASNYPSQNIQHRNSMTKSKPPEREYQVMTPVLHKASQSVHIDNSWRNFADHTIQRISIRLT